MPKSKSLHHRSRRRTSVIATVCCIATVLLLAAVALLLLLPHNEKEPEPPVTPITGTTATTTAATTTTTTVTATTATATTTATAAPTASATKATTRAATKTTLLQYPTDGRYVQATSYTDGTAVPWELLLVNDWNALPEGYENTITVTGVGKRNQRVDKRILEDLNAMLKAGAAYGIDVQSGYRPASQQATLYWRQVKKYTNLSNEEAQKKAGTVVKRPGYSEHNSGLAVDLGGSGNFSLNRAVENTAAFKWLIAHCAEYGFILRFPKEKEAETGVIYEPWHYRYVGREAAAYIMENGLCLEEYLEQTRR